MNFEGFMYLDVENPLIAWNVYRGVLVSQTEIQNGVGSTSSPLSMTMANIFLNRHSDRLHFEMEIEKIRELAFNNCVSRLTCLFVFDEPDSALRAVEDEQWGGHIQSKFLTDVGVSSSAASRLDGNWISWMLGKHSKKEPDWRDGILPYWRGDTCPHFSKPIWEVLVHGSVTIWGTGLRSEAYQTTKSYSPMSVSLLEQSRLAAHLGSNLGHSSAFLVGEKGKLIMQFFVDMRDAHNVSYTDRLHAYITENRALVNFSDLQVAGDTFSTPNFSMYTHVFDLLV